MTHPTDNPPAGARRCLALEAVAKRADIINAFDEDDWTNAFTDADADAMVEFLEASPEDAPVAEWARTLVELEPAVEQLASVVDDDPSTMNAYLFVREMRSHLTGHQADFGRFHIYLLTGKEDPA